MDHAALAGAEWRCVAGEFTDVNPGSLVEGEHAVCWHGDWLVSMTLTSGSIGLPKAGGHSASAHLASAAGVWRRCRLPQDMTGCSSLPLFHVSGQGIVWRRLLAGARLSRYAGKQPLAGRRLHGRTDASLAPTQPWRLLNDDAAVSLKAVLLGGALDPGRNRLNVRKQRHTQLLRAMASPSSPPPVCAKRPIYGAADVGQRCRVRGEKSRRRDSGPAGVEVRPQATGRMPAKIVSSLTNNEGWFAMRDRGLQSITARLTVVGRMDNLFFSGGARDSTCERSQRD